MRIFIYTVSALALMAAGNLVLAHGSGGGNKTYQDKSQGIKLNIAQPHHAPVTREVQPGMELSVEGQKIILKITDADGRPIDAELAEAKTFITTSGKLSTLYLWPVGGNVLSGEGNFKPDPGMRVEIRLRLPDREPVSKDFYPLR